MVALPHSGNWDLAGAWAVHSGMPVTTVAERLADADFDAFVRFRDRLGMEVLSDHDPQVIADLIAAVRRRRLVCLVADRDLLGTGLPVTWAGHPVTMPAGPALVARRTGARLIPAVCQFADQSMVITFGDPVPAEPGRAGLTAMTQAVADFFARTIARRPADWHMMQPFFDRPRGRRPRVGRREPARRSGLPLLLRPARAACRTTSSGWRSICSRPATEPSVLAPGDLPPERAPRRRRGSSRRAPRCRCATTGRWPG